MKASDYNLERDIMLSIPSGRVPYASSVNKFGDNPAVATSATETVWDGSNIYPFPATASITHLRQATDQVGTDGGVVIEIQGLDANWDLVVQNATLSAVDTTVEIVLTTPLRRVFRMKVLSSVVLVADIWVGATGVAAITANGVITAGNNQTLMAIYTVPNGKTAYITKYQASLNKDSGGGSPSAVIKMWHRDNQNGYAPQIKHLLGVDSGANSFFVCNFSPYYKVTQKTDIYINVSNLSGTATADVSAGFDLILLDN